MNRPTRYLIDVSALALHAEPAVAARLDPLILNGLAVTCAVTDLQLLGFASGRPAYVRLAAIRRASCELLQTRDEDLRLALSTQHKLAEQGRLAIAWPCLVVAAVAAGRGVTLLHYDDGYDAIAAVTGQAVEWVVPQGCVGQGRTVVPGSPGSQGTH